MNYPAQAAPRHIFSRLTDDQHLWLFLDYDGTLADFAPNPDMILPDAELIRLLRRLTYHPRLHTAIISGRRLDHICTLVPLQGIWLAGTYGIEMRNPQGETIHMLAYDQVRPVLERIKPQWENLLRDKHDFYLEDKGWSLAVHASRADDASAQRVIQNARKLALQHLDQTLLHLLGGHKFLEVCPQAATKTQAVETILKMDPVPDSIAVFLGDDDKDETAFAAMRSMDGIPILVAAQERPSQALHRLPSPQAARTWLEDLLLFLDHQISTSKPPKPDSHEID